MLKLRPIGRHEREKKRRGDGARTALENEILYVVVFNIVDQM